MILVCPTCGYPMPQCVCRPAGRERGFVFAPWMLTALVYAGIAAVAVAGLWWIYSTIEERGYDRGMAECRQKAQEQRDAEAKRAAGASTTLEKGNEKAKVVYRTITQTVDKIVARDVYRNVCLDADGLSGANAALRGPSPAAGQPDQPVPRSDPAAGRDGGVSATEADRGS